MECYYNTVNTTNGWQMSKTSKEYYQIQESDNFALENDPAYSEWANQQDKEDQFKQDKERQELEWD